MKSLSINEFEAEVIPSSYLVAMEIRRLAREQAKPVVVREETRGEGRAMKIIGKGLLIIASLYFFVHLLVWWVKP